jgi:PAS domain S-box-containing protein
MMGEEEALRERIRRLEWRIGTLESAELECVRAVNALAASEARYRHLLDEAGFPITICEADTSLILFANPLARKLFGLDGTEGQERRILDFYLRPEDRNALVAGLRTSGSVGGREMVMVDGEGRAHVLIVTASLVSYEGRQAILATSNDITERRHTEALFQTLVETSPDGFAIADMEGRLTYVSPRLVGLFGYSGPGEVLGSDIRAFVVPEQRANVAERLASIAAGRHDGPAEWTGIRKDGNTFPEEINGEALRDADGAVRGFFFIVRDLRNRKSLERTMRWAAKLESLGVMAAGIAHELNNAFQVTQGHLEIAQAATAQDPHLTDVLACLGGGLDRASGLAREMLHYSGRTLREEAPVDVDRIVEEGLAIWKEFLAPEARLSFVPDPSLPRVQGDEGQIMKVLSALVLNAVEATPAGGGSITLATRVRNLEPRDFIEGFWPIPGREGPFLILEVKDPGAGIPAERLEKLCDPFYTTKGPGRGLGLSAAMGILRTHSACLQFVSQPGKGTTVRACFPLSAPPREAPRPVEDLGPMLPGVLVAEDDDAIRELVAHKLPDWGYGPVWTARDGLEALECFRLHQDEIGILLTDATMPRMGGPEAFQSMRTLSPSLVGVLMTGYSDAFGKGTCEAHGFASFLIKPFRFKDLKDKLDAARSIRPRIPC